MNAASSQITSSALSARDGKAVLLAIASKCLLVDGKWRTLRVRLPQAAIAIIAGVHHITATRQINRLINLRLLAKEKIGGKEWWVVNLKHLQ